MTTVEDYFAEHVPRDWFDACEVRCDRDEILVIGSRPADDDVAAFRAETKQHRIAIAEKAEALFQRTVSWGVRAGDTEYRFTVASVPTMTRLRFDERALLDTLIDGGVARSRSEALAWCVRTVGERHRDWIEEMREATATLEDLRRRGPGCES